MTDSEVRVPDVGSDDPVDVIEISVNVGDEVELEQTLVVVESAKATVEVPAPRAGTITEVCTQVGKQVKTGDLIFRIKPQALATSDEEEASSIPSNPPENETQAEEASKLEEVKAAKQPSVIEQETLSEKHTQAATQLSSTLPVSEPNDQALVYAGPAVRRLANQLGVDISKVNGTGPKQRILKEDIHTYVKQTMMAAPSSGQATMQDLPKFDFSKWGEIETKPLTKIQHLSAKNLQRAWQMIPHVTQFDEASVSDLEQFRKEENLRLKAKGVKLTMLAFIIKASVKALQTFPKFCASLSDDGKSIVYKHYYHIGFAADTENGLVVPVIRDADQKTVVEIANDLAQLSDRARNKKLKPQEMQGGCFTISSLGGIGGTAFTPIVNWPEVAILGVSRSQEKVVLTDNGVKSNLMLPLSLSYDHRVIDGADAARFTAYLAYLLSDTRRLLL